MKHDDCARFLDALLNSDTPDLPPHWQEHLDACERCRKIYALDRRLEHILADSLRPEPVSDHLLTMLEKNLEDDQRRGHRFPGRAWFLLPAAALLGILLLFVLHPLNRQGLRSLDEIGRLAFADHHNIQQVEFMHGNPDELAARFSAKLGFPVQIPQVIGKGYRFIGGRICLLGRCRAAWLVYGHGATRVSLFILDADDLAFSLARPKKYILQYADNTVKIWQKHGQVYALVD